jgi:hypothetical protein
MAASIVAARPLHFLQTIGHHERTFVAWRRRHGRFVAEFSTMTPAWAALVVSPALRLWPE